MNKINKIDVYIWNSKVGSVVLDPVLEYYVFMYDPSFAKRGIELSPLHMPLIAAENPFVFPELPELTYKRLPAMLADALPDDFGNALIDCYMATKGVSHSQISVLDRLAYMGSRAMGALEFKPVHGPRTHSAIAIEMNTLVDEARAVVQGKLGAPDNINAALRSIIEVGTSAGGIRAKAVIAWNPITNEIRSGQAEVPPGFEHWLLKFDGMGIDKELGNSQDYGRIEYAYYLMAKEAKINISESHLLQENSRAHFMTKRFDRANHNVKHHLLTLCAIKHLDYRKKSTNSYEQLFLTMQELKLSYEMQIEALRRMIFNIMARNCDDHTKNIAFILKQGSSWELAPAYDLTFAYNPHGEWTHQHLMSVNGKFKDITLQDVLTIAQRFVLGNVEQVIADVCNAVQQWPKFAAISAVSPQIVKKISGLHNIYK